MAWPIECASNPAEGHDWGHKLPEIFVRFKDLPGIADTPWLQTSPGISVMTGRNNVGKSRLMRAVNALQSASQAAGLYEVPEIRVSDGPIGVEADLRGVPTAPTYAPRSYIVRRQGVAVYETEWRPEGTQAVLRNRAPGSAGGQSGYGGGVNFTSIGDLPDKAYIADAVARFIYVPPQRNVTSSAPTNPLRVPSPTGSDLGQALYYHMMKGTAQATEIQETMTDLFREVEKVVLDPTTNGQVTLMVRDRYAGDIALDNTGTGLSAMLNLVAMVVLQPEGRIFLVDEPTSFLHPGAEKQLAAFLRDHAEHDYVITTHSPVFLNAIQPDRVWLVTRNERGTGVSRAYGEKAGREHVFAELGIAPGDIALSEKVLFIEGPSDVDIFSTIVDKLGWNLEELNCQLVPLTGFGAAGPVQDAFDRLSHAINIRYLVYLDGDRSGTIYGENIGFLPVPEIENVLIRDADAVLLGITSIVESENAELAGQIRAEWDANRVRAFADERIAQHAQVKGSKVLTDLCFEMTTTYRKTVHGPAIAAAMKTEHVADIRDDLAAFLEGEGTTIHQEGPDEVI